MKNLILFVLVAGAALWLWAESNKAKTTATDTKKRPTDKDAKDVVPNPLQPSPTVNLGLASELRDLPLVRLTPTIVSQPPRTNPFAIASSNFSGQLTAIEARKPHCLTMAINQPWYVIPGRTCRMNGSLN